jgi:DeoR/GlpR family transcriptional regulator of sugar metabolism
MLVLKEVLAQSNEVVAAVTADKVSQIARYKVVACEDIDIVVVSSDANIDNFRHLNMRIEVAEE